MVQICVQVVSFIENKDTNCNFLHWLQNSDYFTSTVVEYYYFGGQKLCKIKMEPFLKQEIDLSTYENIYIENGVFRNS